VEPKVLIVEDERTLLETLQYNLERQGYEVLLASDGLEGLELARKQEPDLIILDLNLPRLDGLEVCRLVRHELSMPILMLTARVDEVDKIVGLEVGADDYMVKPFSMRELLARTKALLRRERIIREKLAGQNGESEDEATAQAAPLVYGNLTVDMNRREVLVGGEAVSLKPKEYELLAFLARHRGMVLSRDLILERVWGWSYGGGSRTVDVHVRWLREKIEERPSDPVRIITVRGVGYRFDG